MLVVRITVKLDADSKKKANPDKSAKSKQKTPENVSSSECNQTISEHVAPNPVSSQPADKCVSEETMKRFKKVLMSNQKVQLVQAFLHYARTCPSSIPIIADQLNPAPKRHSGVISIWLHEKRMGFILKDGGGKVFVHRDDVRLKNGDRNPKVGAAVTFEVVNSKKGGRAKDVCAAVGGGPVEGGRHSGTVKSFDTEKWRWTIEPDDGTGDLFLTAKHVWNETGTVAIGDKVLFDPQRVIENGERRAIYCTLTGHEILLCETCGEAGHFWRYCTQGGGDGATDNGNDHDYGTTGANANLTKNAEGFITFDMS